MSEIAKIIDRVIRVSVAPLLKQHGFRKTGRTFRRVEDRCTKVVNIQGGKWNSNDSGEFTINLGVYHPALVPLLEWARLTDRPTEADCVVRERIGILMPGARDHWWSVTPETDLDTLASEVRCALEQYGLPWLDTHSDLESAREFTRKKGVPYWAAAMSILLDDIAAARTYYNEALGNSPPGSDLESRLKAWGLKHGLLNAPPV